MARSPRESASALLRGCEDPGLARREAAEDEVQTHEGLPGSGGAGDKGAGSSPVPIVEQVVERLDAGGDADPVDVVARRIESIGNSGEDVDAALGDPVRVLARRVRATSHLEHFEDPSRSRT